MRDYIKFTTWYYQENMTLLLHRLLSYVMVFSGTTILVKPTKLKDWSGKFMYMFSKQYLKFQQNEALL